MCIWLQQKNTEQKSILISKQVYRGVENALFNRQNNKRGGFQPGP